MIETFSVLYITFFKMGKKKPFINKKEAVSFHLVHRSQRDPLQADEESSKHVLQQLALPNEKKKEQEKKQEEQRKFGVFYEDEYNYMQHLRHAKPECVWQADADPNAPPKPSRSVKSAGDTKEEKPKIQLSSKVFGSEREEEVGLLNKAAPITGPRFDLDPDVVAAMDVDFNFDDPDNQLDDDFMQVAQGDDLPDATERLSGEDESDDESGEDYDSDELDSYDGDNNDDETKSRFTSYSLSSSVMRRTDGLTLLDDRFEKIYEEYDDLEIGALDHDEIEGYVPEQSAVLTQAINEYEEKEATNKSSLEDARKAAGEAVMEDSDSEDEGLVKMSVEMPNKDRWDCESILSTYSNLYNHPRTIKEPANNKKNHIILSQKTGMPLNVLPKPGPTKKQLEKEMLEEMRLPMEYNNRTKGTKETAEERKERKHAVKTERKARRMEKKTNKLAFKDEEKRQGKVMMNLKQNLQGIKMV